MYIHEAIMARTEEKPWITREAYVEEQGRAIWTDIKIFPTNGPDGMIVSSSAARPPSRGWQPRKEDLLADDWITTGKK